MIALHMHKLFFFALVLMVSMIPSTLVNTSNDITTQAPVAKKIAVDAKQIACLAKNIYYEAGYESLHGQAAVAHVVMNRVRHGFGNNPCQVIYQKTLVNDKMVCQFSWVCENKGEPPRNRRYEMAKQVAYDVMVDNKYHEVLPRTALFFHNTTVDPLWPYKQVARIGGHIFYSKAKKVTPTKSKE